MVFNLASAGLTWSSWLANSTTAAVSYDAYCLSITELALICVSVCLILTTTQNQVVSFLLFTAQVYNMAYSILAIQHYNGHIPVDQTFANMTLSILILNPLAICGCLGTHRAQRER